MAATTKATDLGMHTEQLAGRSQQRFFRPEEEERIRKKWEGTTPQGREIIRKKLHAFKKKLAAEENAAAQANSEHAPASPVASA